VNDVLMLLFLFLGLSVFQAVFNGYETGFVSSNPIRIRFLAEENQLKRAARLLGHLTRPDTMLTTLLIAMNFCLVAGTLTMSKVLPDATLAMLVLTPFYLIVVEIIPKSIFRIHPNRLSLYMLPFIQVVLTVLAPVVLPVTWITRFLLRFAGGTKQAISPLMSSIEDVRFLVDESAAHGTIEREEQRMIHSVMGLQEKQAKEIMVPRIDIEALPETASRNELIAVFERSGRTRIPIYKETIDTVAGIANVYDVLLEPVQHENGDSTGIARYVKPVPHVPDTIKVSDLLKTMLREKQHLAIVTDEYGGTDGLITLEDILEEIFGDIQDEHDREEREILHVGPNAYVVDARATLESLSQAIDIQIVDPQVETVGGWLMHIAGNIPAQGQVIHHKGFHVTVLEGTNNSIAKIRLEVSPEARAFDADPR
jgi:putative hemolysin